MSRMLDAAKTILDALRAEGLDDKELIDMLFQIQRKDIVIPVNVLGDRRLGALEAITLYLKEKEKLAYHDIAVLLNRDDRTIWSTYRKARMKVAGVSENERRI